MKQQYDIIREAAKISTLSSGKIDNYEYFTGEEILPTDQSIVIEQVTFTYSLTENALEKQIKTIEDQGEKQIKALEGHVKQLDNVYSYKDKLLLSKKREIFKNIYKKRLDKIEE